MSLTFRSDSMHQPNYFQSIIFYLQGEKNAKYSHSKRFIIKQIHESPFGPKNTLQCTTRGYQIMPNEFQSSYTSSNLSKPHLSFENAHLFSAFLLFRKRPTLYTRQENATSEISIQTFLIKISLDQIT